MGPLANLVEDASILGENRRWFEWLRQRRLGTAT